MDNQQRFAALVSIIDTNQLDLPSKFEDKVVLDAVSLRGLRDALSYFKELQALEYTEGGEISRTKLGWTQFRWANNNISITAGALDPVLQWPDVTELPRWTIRGQWLVNRCLMNFPGAGDTPIGVVAFDVDASATAEGSGESVDLTGYVDLKDMQGNVVYRVDITDDEQTLADEFSVYIADLLALVD